MVNSWKVCHNFFLKKKELFYYSFICVHMCIRVSTEARTGCQTPWCWCHSSCELPALVAGKQIIVLWPQVLLTMSHRLSSPCDSSCRGVYTVLWNAWEGPDGKCFPCKAHLTCSQVSTVWFSDKTLGCTHELCIITHLPSSIPSLQSFNNVKHILSPWAIQK